MRPPSDFQISFSWPLFSIVVLCVVLLGLIVAVTALQLQLGSLQAQIEEAEAAEADMKDSGPGERAADGDSEIFEAAVDGIDELLRQRNAADARRLFEALTAEHGPISVVEGTGLRIRFDTEFEATLLRNGRRYFSLSADEAGGAVEIESRLGDSITASNQSAEAREFVVSRREALDKIVAAETEMRERLEALENAPEISRLLESRGMHMTRIVRDGFVLRRGVANASGAVIVRLAAHADEREYRVDGEALGESADLESTVSGAIRAYDPEEELRRVRKQLENRLSQPLEDEGFNAFLEERGLRVTETKPGGNLERGLQTQEGESAGRFVIDPKRGVIELVGADGKRSWTLDRPAVTHAPAAGDDEPDEHPGFLLLGRHEELTDAIMVVKPGNSDASVISVPRDMYLDGLNGFAGRKLNELFALEGPERMMDTVTELTGVELDHYVAVDMDGFAEVVDALGTIEVEFNSEFLDPTMHYHVDGEQRMLYFPPGTHEVNGEGALALARSRKTSSDFGRSRRQRLLVEGIRRRLDQLALSDAGRLYDLLKVALERSETDMGFTDVLRYYRRYRDLADIRHTVLSSNNVLYSTYVDLYKEGGAVEGAGEVARDDAGAWILRPRGEDWGIVQWYVDTWLSGAQPEVDQYLDRRTESHEDTLFESSEFLKDLDQRTDLDLRILFELERELEM